MMPPCWFTLCCCVDGDGEDGDGVVDVCVLVGNGSMLIKGRVETRREEWGLVMLIIISCFWDGGK